MAFAILTSFAQAQSNPATFPNNLTGLESANSMTGYMQGIEAFVPYAEAIVILAWIVAFGVSKLLGADVGNSAVAGFFIAMIFSIMFVIMQVLNEAWLYGSIIAFAAVIALRLNYRR